jgi:dipeptidyl aminopeptidase/acylaminoacyl peptidase
VSLTRTQLQHQQYSSLVRPGIILLAAAYAVGALAQSGNPAPIQPLPTHDPRLVDFWANATNTQAIYFSATHTQAPSGVALSPDGATVAWTIGDGKGFALHLTPLAHPNTAADKIVSPINAGPCFNTSPVWSPDSKTIAYTSTCTTENTAKSGDAQSQIFLYSVATGQSRQLTHITGIFQAPVWAPDGKSLAFLFVENATRESSPLAAITPWSGVIGEDGIEVQRVYSVDAITGQGAWLTPTTLHAYEFDFAPDSKHIAFTAANPPGDNNWWIAKLFTIAITANAAPQVAFDPNTTTTAMHGLQMALPRFSPDGKRIAFIGGLMSDEGSNGGDVWVVTPKNDDNTAQDITPDIDGSPSFEIWLTKDTLGLVENRRGHTLLATYDANKQAMVPGRVLDFGEVILGGFGLGGDAPLSVSRNGVLAFVKSGHETPAELWAGPGAALRQITDLNNPNAPHAHIESVEWTNEGFHVQGWLTYPSNYDPTRKYPVLVQVHGGPSAAVPTGWGRSLLAELGFFEFEPNPRGSFGQGEKFTAANRKDFGYGDLRDILSGLDAVEKQVPAIDSNREAITGWSYGGFMTMFAVTQTNRFKAAIAGAGNPNWQSYYGENSIDQWMLPFFGKTVYDDPAVYAKSSAINFIHNVKTPTLVLVGDRDGEVPAPQSFEFWHALRALGVKTQLVVYPNEGHLFENPDHIRDRSERVLQWLNTYMPAQ